MSAVYTYSINCGCSHYLQRKLLRVIKLFIRQMQGGWEGELNRQYCLLALKSLSLPCYSLFGSHCHDIQYDTLKGFWFSHGPPWWSKVQSQPRMLFTSYKITKSSHEMLLFTSGSIELILIIAVPDDPSALDESTHLLHCHPGRHCLSRSLEPASSKEGGLLCGLSGLGAWTRVVRSLPLHSFLPYISPP